MPRSAGAKGRRRDLSCDASRDQPAKDVRRRLIKLDEPIAAGFAGVNFRNIAFAEMLRVYEPRRDQGIGQVPDSFRILSGNRRKTALAW